MGHRIFVEEYFCSKWVRVNLPIRFRYDDELGVNELIAWSPVFERALRNQLGPDADVGLPCGFLDEDLYEEPFCNEPRFTTLKEMLTHPWETIPSPDAQPLFRREDLERSVFDDCVLDLAVLAKVAGLAQISLDQIRLVWWLEEG